MVESSVNHYERAFENWLISNHIKYTAIDQNKRVAFGKAKIKSFDFILYPNDNLTIMAEVKGRIFKGTTFEKLTSFECWVLADDVEGLVQWQSVFGAEHEVIFVFAYKIENVDVDFDGRQVFDYQSGRYVFFAIRLEEYLKYMKQRSPKWRTVNLAADKFRQCARQLEEILL